MKKLLSLLKERSRKSVFRGIAYLGWNSLFIFCLFCVPAFADDNNKLKTPNSEMQEALNFLLTRPDSDRPFIRFFTTYSIPTDIEVLINSDIGEEIETVSLRDATVKILDFWIHSLSAGAVIAPVRQITDTLYWVDIRDYNWTPQGFEKVAEQDPYFLQPWIDHDRYQVFRLEAGNAIVRADWFIIHTSDVVRQVDRNRAPLYYELTYSSTKPPETAKEFWEFWRYDVEQIEGLRKDGSIGPSLAKGSVIDMGESGVSRHNRQLWRGRVESGYYWISQDVKNMIGPRDFQQNLFPGLRKKDFDASEHIGTNLLQLQVYLLTDAEGKRIEFADNGVVTDHSDNNDKRVRSAKSCVICHPLGINQAPNSLREVLRKGLEIRFQNKEDQIRYAAFYLDSEFDVLIKDDQEIYRRAVKRVNGLDPEENARIFQELFEWYDEPITATQAALETGVKEDELRPRLEKTISERIGALITGGTVPREVWEEPQGGAFAECMLRIYSLKPLSKEPQVKPNPVPIQQTNKESAMNKTKKTIDDYPKYKVNLETSLLGTKGEEIQKIPVGATVISFTEVDGYNYIEYNKVRGYVRSVNLTKETSNQ